MGMLNLKKVPLPVSFMVVMTMLIGLFVFFGAWAVTVDAANHDRQLSFAIGSNLSLGVNPLPVPPNNQSTIAQVEESRSAADTWWGSSLLFACPLH